MKKIVLLIAMVVLIAGCEDRSGVFRPTSARVPQQEDPRLTKFSDCQGAPEKLIGMTISAVMDKCDRKNAYQTRTLATADGMTVLFVFDYLQGAGGICCPIIRSPKLYVYVRNDIVIRAAN